RREKSEERRKSPRRRSSARTGKTHHSRSAQTPYHHPANTQGRSAENLSQTAHALSPRQVSRRRLVPRTRRGKSPPHQHRLGTRPGKAPGLNLSPPPA